MNRIKGGLIARYGRTTRIISGRDESGKVLAAAYVANEGGEQCVKVGTGRTIGRAARSLLRSVEAENWLSDACEHDATYGN